MHACTECILCECTVQGKVGSTRDLIRIFADGKKYIKFHSEGPMFESSRDIHIKDQIIVDIRDVNDEFFDCVLK